MKTHKCDRCGEQYKVVDTTPPYRCEERVEKSNGNMAYVFVKLCPACELSFQNWLENSVADEKKMLGEINTAIYENFFSPFDENPKHFGFGKEND